MPSGTTSQRQAAVSSNNATAFRTLQGRRTNKPTQRPRMSARHYSSTEWDSNKSIIIQLYQEDRMSMADLLVRLRRMGFEVNERMLHTRIKKWKIGRNHKFNEMRTAAVLLGAHQDQQDQHIRPPSRSQRTSSNTRIEMPSFSIRGDNISYKELLRYFRRKKIHDPINWVRERNDDIFVLSDDVELITAADVGVKDSSSSQDVVEVGHHNDATATLPVGLDEQRSFEEIKDALELSHGNANALCDDIHDVPQHQIDMVDPVSPGASSALSQRHTNNSTTKSSVPSFIRPYTYHALERMTYNMNIYMASYAEIPNRRTDKEPTVHAQMAHAIFASKMQDGIFILRRIPPPYSTGNAVSRRARPHPTTTEAKAMFNSGFQMIPEILLNHSPMSLALILSIICEFAGHTTSASRCSLGIRSLLQQFLPYIQVIAATVLGSQHPLTYIFRVLTEELITITALLSTETPPLAEMIFTAFEVAISQMQIFGDIPATSNSQSQDWRQLYLCERFCDAVYYSGPAFQQTRASMRKQLLFDQERKYGLAARNVLWTLTNVADDCLANSDVDAAIGWFGEALDRAETLVEDYGRAKTRFAAFEGLGWCWLAKGLAFESEERKLGNAESHGYAMTLSNHHEGAFASQLPASAVILPRCSCRCHASHTGSASVTETSTPSRQSMSLPGSSRTQSPHSHHTSKSQYLQNALDFFSKAENEARAYFDPSSRRIARVTAKRMEVVEMLGMATPMTGSTGSSSKASPDLNGVVLGGDASNGVQAFDLDLHQKMDFSANAGDDSNGYLENADDARYGSGRATLQEASLSGMEMDSSRLRAYVHKREANDVNASAPGLGQIATVPIIMETGTHAMVAAGDGSDEQMLFHSSNYLQQHEMYAPYQEVWYGLGAGASSVNVRLW